MKKALMPTVLAVILIAVSAWALIIEKKPTALPAPANNSSNLIFYYGDGCSHCSKVEKYFADNGVEAKVKFEKKEVYNNQANQDELINRAGACGLDKAKIGIPLLWNNGQCLTGDSEIINFFEQAIKQPNK
jgi:glutaredoxin